MTEKAEGAMSPLDIYVAPARPPGGFWRVVAGVAMLAGITLAISIGLVGAFFLWQRLVGAIGGPGIAAGAEAAMAEPSVAGVGIALASVAILWPVLWLVLRLLHGQRLRTLFSPEGRIRWREFARGAAILLAFSFVASFLTAPVGSAPERSDVPLGLWAAQLLPLGFLIFLQVTAEELVFRGYLLQQLAIRWASPVVWAGVPSALFCILHWNPALEPVEQVSYFAATFLFGLVAAATVARTGSLATAMGMHWISNMLAIAVVAQPGILDDAALFVQEREGTLADLAIVAASMGVLLLWVVSPFSPVPRRPVLSRPPAVSADLGEPR